MLSENTNRYQILIADDELEQGKEICDLIYQTVSSFPGSMGVSRDQLDIKVISKVAEMDSDVRKDKDIQNIYIPFSQPLIGTAIVKIKLERSTIADEDFSIP
jgi:hypothetical protein